MKNKPTIFEEINVADAHPSGKRPFKRDQYIKKFKTLTDGIISKKESNRFLKVVQNLRKLKARDLEKLNIQMIPSEIKKTTRNKKKTKNKVIFK